MIRRAGEHRRQSLQIQISGFTSGRKLDILHCGQRNTHEQVERTALETDEDLDVDGFRNRTVCRMDNRGTKHQTCADRDEHTGSSPQPFCNTHFFESVYAGKTM
jgi:hypothetical protein